MKPQLLQSETEMLKALGIARREFPSDKERQAEALRLWNDECAPAVQAFLDTLELGSSLKEKSENSDPLTAESAKRELETLVGPEGMDGTGVKCMMKAQQALTHLTEVAGLGWWYYIAEKDQPAAEILMNVLAAGKGHVQIVSATKVTQHDKFDD
jgi:hypothetical protein